MRGNLPRDLALFSRTPGKRGWILSRRHGVHVVAPGNANFRGLGRIRAGTGRLRFCEHAEPDLFAGGSRLGLFTNLTLNTLDDLLVVQLQDLYDAEQRLTKALPKMAEAASDKKLSTAFQHHLGETEDQVARLEKIFEILELTPQRQTCEAMKGLIAEGDEAIDAEGALTSGMRP